MHSELFDSLDRQLTQVCSPAVIRAIESGSSHRALWQSLLDSGFVDLLVDQDSGGSGLGWSDAWPVLFAVGRHAVPVPFGTSMYARALFAQLGRPFNADNIVAVSGFGQLDRQGRLTANGVGSVALADEIIVQAGDQVYRADIAQCSIERTAGPGCFDGHVVIARPELMGALPAGTLAHAVALVLAVELAGLADRVLEMTLRYANDRQQFGKPIGRFQAVQQQITEMAERVYAMRMASQLGVQCPSIHPLALKAALAKSQTSASASRVASTAHAVHGAIGVTQEYDLQIYTRRLYELARAGAGEQFWATQIGQAAFTTGQGLLDFTREVLFGSKRGDLPAV